VSLAGGDPDPEIVEFLASLEPTRVASDIDALLLIDHLSTEAADLTGLSVPYAGSVLTSLEEEGVLKPGRDNKAGRGFYYIPAR
jgi:hypothetical protein